jgi:hypothetical protein
LFKLSDFTKWWGPEWSLERAGFGGGTGGISGIRGATYLDGDILSVFPRDEVRGALLRQTVQLSESPSLDFDAGVDPGKSWHLQVYVNNDRVLDKLIEDPTSLGQERPTGEPPVHPTEGAGTVLEGPPDTKAIEAARRWEHIHLDLSAYKSQSVVIRLYDLILVPGHEAGNSYWKKPRLQ